MKHLKIRCLVCIAIILMEKESAKTALAYMALIEPAFGDEIVRKRFEWK